ncbi:AraC family transcriptional regulator [Actibacterium sp. XHP0104]|uniref:AraC family transcriptional regulator n=1 Tax=Actibacterium sp. XHP0104 TaxID=2984335 RepID=UPI0021E6E0A4|nr:AraC family transcriptional regulator [Actibacterium sp. XHP0104]MCV2882985.1 AraC family transcriptional regulator [Actibacterium sp. XHP0104]
MINASDPVSLTTVSRGLIADWLEAMRRCFSDPEMRDLLRRAGLEASQDHPNARVTLEQIVAIYQIAAVESGDEMMGLWSRPIRSRALQHLLTTVLAADTLRSALHRFSTFWNLLLEDFRFDLTDQGRTLTLSLHPLGEGPVQRFGHLLILKLAHGVLSWLAGYEVPVHSVHFAFAQPPYAEDYTVIFPARVGFDAPCSEISFDASTLGTPVARNKSELVDFVKRAPRDWIFTAYREHAQSLRVREFLFRSNWQNCRLVDAADAFRMTPRTLMRRLDAEGTSFQAIKDALRRDIAIRDLRETRKTVDQIAEDLGFSSATNFHRAFRRWTGDTPGAHRDRPSDYLVLSRPQPD